MRVLVVCDWFLKYAASQSASLHRAGAEVLLLCRDHALEFGGASLEFETTLRDLDGVRVLALPGRVSSVAALRQLPAVRREARGWRPDIVHAHDNGDPRLLWIVGAHTRVTTLHDPRPHPGQPLPSAIERSVRRRWLTGSAAIVVHGRALVDELPDWARSTRVFTIPHGAPVRERPLSGRPVDRVALRTARALQGRRRPPGCDDPRVERTSRGATGDRRKRS